MSEQSIATTQPKQEPKAFARWANRRIRASLLGDPLYAKFWWSRLLSQTAHGAILYALLIIVTDLTDASIFTSVFVICAIVPAILFGLPAGISVDTLPRIPLMVCLNFLRVMFVMALIDSDMTLVGIFAVAMGLWTIHQFYSPAESALMASLVDKKLFPDAQSLSNLALSVAQFLGLVVVAPITLRFGSPSTLFALCGALWIAAAILVGMLPNRQNELTLARKLRGSLRQNLGNGWRLVRTDHAIYEVFIDDVLVGIGGSAIIVLMPLYLKGVLDTGAENTVFVFAPAAIGLLLGLRIAPTLIRSIGGRRTATGALILFSVTIAMFGYINLVLRFLDETLGLPISEISDRLGLAPVALMVMILSIPSGLATSIGSVSARSVMLARTPPEFRGQVIATQSLFQNLGALVPTLLVGIAADIVGVQRVAVAIAVLIVAGAIAALTIYRPQAARVRMSPAQR